MTGDTPFDSLPRLIRFDRDLCALSASSIDRILHHIATDALGVAKDIVFHATLQRDKYHKKDDVWQHAMLTLCEIAQDRPDELRELVTQQRWRYWFARMSSIQFRSTTSRWHVTHIRPGTIAAEDLSAVQDPVQPADDLADLMAIADPKNGPEADMTRFLSNLSILFREVEWYHQRLWAAYHVDHYGWLKEEQQTKPKAKMSYRFLQAKTGIPHQNIQRVVQDVNQFIRDNYESKFNEPLPRHLLNKF